MSITKEEAQEILEELRYQADWAYEQEANHSCSCSQETYAELDRKRQDLAYKAHQLNEFLEDLASD